MLRDQEYKFNNGNQIRGQGRKSTDDALRIVCEQFGWHGKEEYQLNGTTAFENIDKRKLLHGLKREK